MIVTKTRNKAHRYPKQEKETAVHGTRHRDYRGQNKTLLWCFLLLRPLPLLLLLISDYNLVFVCAFFTFLTINRLLSKRSSYLV